MKQTIRIAVVLLIGVAFSLGWGLITSSEENELAKTSLIKKNKSLAQSLDKKESEFNEMYRMMTDVEDQVREIVEKENLVYNHNLEGVQPTGHDRLVQEIEMIDELVIRSKANIQSLEQKIRSANLKTNVFQDRLTRLSAQLKAKETVITDLKAEIRVKDESIELMNRQVGALIEAAVEQSDVLAEKEQEINFLTNENNALNKAYLAVGSFKELKDRGLVQRQGGFLWFGRTIDVQEDADRGEFLEVDIREVSMLPVKASALNLLSEHPADSYKVVPGATEDMKILEITNPDEFWKVSKYLVISKKT
jgi:uncharacterized protein (DUF3084 family)